eukprot:s929_g14.t1
MQQSVSRCFRAMETIHVSLDALPDLLQQQHRELLQRPDAQDHMLRGVLFKRPSSCRSPPTPQILLRNSPRPVSSRKVRSSLPGELKPAVGRLHGPDLAESKRKEPSIKAFVKGLSDEACEMFLQHSAQRMGEDKAVAVVAPQLAKIKDWLVLSKGPKEQSIFSMDFMLTELPAHRPQSALSQISHRSQDGWHENGIHSESVGLLARRHSQAFGYRGARTEDTLTVVEEAVQQATAEAEAEVAEADKEKALAEAAKEAALAKEFCRFGVCQWYDLALPRNVEKELEAELEALKANMEREIQERATKIQELREAAEGDDGTAMAALLAHAKEEAKRAADEKIKEKERALKAAQEAAESQAAAFLERQEAALRAAELLAQREADAREAKRKAEEEAAALRAQRRASDVKIEEAAKSMAAAEAAKMAALREREEALEMKAILERRQQEEEEARQAAEARQAQAEAQRVAAEAAEKALEELDSQGEGLSAEEREALQAKAAEDRPRGGADPDSTSAKALEEEEAEKAAQEAQALAAFAQQRALEAEKQMNEATVTAHFQVLAKLSRVQAAYASLEDRLRLQEEVTAYAEKRAKEAEEREEQLCLLVSAKALARQVRQRDRMAQTLLACEQDGEEQWRLAVDGEPAHLQCLPEVAAPWTYEGNDATNNANIAAIPANQPRAGEIDVQLRLAGEALQSGNTFIRDSVIDTAATEVLALVAIELAASGHHRLSSNETINKPLEKSVVAWATLATFAGMAERLQNLIFGACTAWIPTPS